MGKFAQFIPHIIAAATGQWWALAILTAGTAVGSYQQRRARRKARDAFNAGLQDRLVMTATADRARSRVYGRVRNVDGIIFKATHGTHQEFYTLVVALAGHQIDAIEKVFFNDVEVSLDANGYVQTAPYNRLDNNSATAPIIIGGGAGSATLPQTPVAASISVHVTTGVGGDVGSIEVTQVPFTLAGATVTVSGAQFPNGDLISAVGVVSYQHSAGTSYARVRKYLGGSTQDISNEMAALVPTLCVSGQHKFNGIALLLVTLEFSQDAYPGGVPQITGVMRGAICYDWRPATMGWTENPALIAYDWATYAFGGNLGTQEVDIATFTAAANACDVSTVFSTKYIQDAGEIVPTDTVAPRFRCGLVALTDSNAGDVFEEITAAMAGQHGWQGGKLRVRPGAWRAPVATITEDWISDAEGQAIDPSTGVQDTYNILRPRISDASRDYVITPMPQVRAEAYVTADGQELPAEITLSAVTEDFRALDICEIMLLEGRQALATSLPCKFHAFALELFDVVEVTLPHYGWTAKDYELRGVRFSPQGGVIPLLREVSAASYDPATLFTLDDLADNTELPKPWLIDPVMGLAVTSSALLSPDAQIVSRTLLTWLPHTQAAVRQNGRIELQYLDLGGAPQTMQWVNEDGDIVGWEDDDGSGVEWVSGTSGVALLLTWENDGGTMAWENDVESTLEWYTEVGASIIPAGDWNAEYEPGGATSHQIVGLSPGHAYLFRARAINSVGVRSAWSTQLSLIIPTQPLVQTEGLAVGATYELVTTPVGTDSFTTTATGIQDRILATTTYTNDTGEDVGVEFALTSQRRVTTPASASLLDVLGFLSIVDYPDYVGDPGFGTLVSPPTSGVNHIEDMGASESRVFNESVTWSVALADGHTVQAKSYVRFYQGAYSGVVLDTSNLTLRMTVVKR